MQMANTRVVVLDDVGDVCNNGKSAGNSGSTSDSIVMDDECSWYSLARSLSEQPWHEIGNCAPPIAATSSLNEMVDQLSSLLHVHLRNLVASRFCRVNVANKAETTNHAAMVVNDNRNMDVIKSGYDEKDKKDIGISPRTIPRNDHNVGASSKCDAREYLTEDGNDLHPNLITNLREYVTEICQSYNNVHFHSLQHATHVTLSMNKLVAILTRFGHLNQVQLHPVHQQGAEGESTSGDGIDEERKKHKNKKKEKARSRRSTLQHVEYNISDEIDRKPRKRDSQNPEEYCNNINDDSDSDKADDEDDEETQNFRCDPSFGISSNAMACFALVFAAMIHDVDHPGIANAQLVEDGHEWAIMHNDSSVLEQHSLQVAFSLLMSERYSILRSAITPTADDRRAFRKMVIEIILITDISSPERMQLVKSKWREAFEAEGTSRREGFELSHEKNQLGHTKRSGSGGTATHHILRRPRRHSMYASEVSKRHLLRIRLGIRQSLHLNGKFIDTYAATKDGDARICASSVMELMMNVADVAHTMQGFDIFCKWNRQLYMELLVAHDAGQCSWDPAEKWYENQINFYDAYIIPLAERLEMCGAFGNQGSVLLYFAMENKRKWIKEGRTITTAMMQSVVRELASEVGM